MAESETSFVAVSRWLWQRVWQSGEYFGLLWVRVRMQEWSTPYNHCQYTWVKKNARTNQIPLHKRMRNSMEQRNFWHQHPNPSELHHVLHHQPALLDTTVARVLSNSCRATRAGTKTKWRVTLHWMGRRTYQDKEDWWRRTEVFLKDFLLTEVVVVRSNCLKH